jgi:hypothetical protein
MIFCLPEQGLDLRGDRNLIFLGGSILGVHLSSLWIYNIIFQQSGQQPQRKFKYQDKNFPILWIRVDPHLSALRGLWRNEGAVLIQRLEVNDLQLQGAPALI